MMNGISGTVLLFLFCTVAQATQIKLKSTIRNDSADVRGLDGAKRVLVSSDDRFVYVAGENSSAVSWFERDGATGELSFAGHVRSDSAGVTGLQYVYDIAFGKDERTLYAVTYYSNTLVWFSRDSENGALRYEGTLTDQEGGIEGLYIPIRLVVAPSGKNLYTVSMNDNAICLFAISPESGEPVFREMYRDGEGSIDGLGEVQDICITPDGKFACVVARDDSALTVFSVDRETAKLTQVAQYRADEISSVTMRAPTICLADREGKYLYIGNHGTGAIAWFECDAVTGRATYRGEVVNERNGVEGLYYLSDMQLFDGGKKIIATSYDGITLFDIGDDGALNFSELITGIPGNCIAFTGDCSELFIGNFSGFLLVAEYTAALSIRERVPMQLSLYRNVTSLLPSCNLAGRIVLRKNIPDAMNIYLRRPAEGRCEKILWRR